MAEAQTIYEYLKAYTMNSLCPACEAHRRHTLEDWQAHHPYATHGYVLEQGWTHEDLTEQKKAEAHE